MPLWTRVSSSDKFGGKVKQMQHVHTVYNYMNALGHIYQEPLGEGGGHFPPVKKAVLIHSIIYPYHIIFRWFH